MPQSDSSFATLKRKLTHAIFSAEDEHNHAECLAHLPAYVDAEMAGAKLAELFPHAHAHLKTCESCAAQYTQLLAVSLAEARDEIAFAAPAPEPDLSFLPPTLAEFVTAHAKRIATTLGKVTDFDALAEAFFERLDELGGQFVLQTPQTGHALGVAPTGVSPTMAILAAVYTATNDLRASLTPAQVDGLVAEQRLTAHIEARAREALRPLGLDAARARDLAHTFAENVSADPRALKLFLVDQP